MVYLVVTPTLDGSHGWVPVGPFATEDEATTWLAGREGMIKPLVTPGDHDRLGDEAREEEVS